MDAIYTTLGIPFGYVLRFIFEAVDNYGLALILFTLFARLLMIPTSIYQTKGTVKTQRLQPKIRRINAKYKGDQKKIQEETQALYQREGHNPMNMGCLPLAIPVSYTHLDVYKRQPERCSEACRTSAMRSARSALQTRYTANFCRRNSGY